MTCEHISKALDKVNNLIKKSNDTDSSLYKVLKSIVDKDTIKSHLDGGVWSGYSASTSYKYYDFPYISHNALYDNLSDIFDELKSCNCRNEIVKEFNNLSGNSTEKYNKLVNEYNDLLGKNKKYIADFNDLVEKFNDRGRDYKLLQEKYNRLVDDYNDKNTDYQDIKEKYESTQEELNDEKLKHAKSAGDEKLKYLGEKSQLQI